MHIEEQKAWYITSRGNILNCLDLATNQVKFAKLLPNSDMDRTRLNAKCIKCGHLVFCAPCYDKDFWIYDLQTNTFEKLELELQGNVRPVVWDMYKTDHTLYALSKGLKELIEIDIEKRRIIKKYPLAEDGEIITNSIAAEDNWYFLISSANARICRLNMHTKVMDYFDFPMIKETVNGFCYDGSVFCISGSGKYLYRWNPAENQVEQLDCFPDQFGAYDFSREKEKLIDYDLDHNQDILFCSLTNTNTYIWCIPYIANKIIYINKSTKKADIYNIPEEEETEESIKDREFAHKYLFLYQKEDRYIGLYSLKQKVILEIDTLTLERRYIEPKVQEAALLELFKKAIDENKVIIEKKNHLHAYLKVVGGSKEKKQSESDNEPENVGEKVYSYMKKEQ
jgi:hypothetical protein